MWTRGALVAAPVIKYSGKNNLEEKGLCHLKVSGYSPSQQEKRIVSSALSSLRSVQGPAHQMVPPTLTHLSYPN